ncbi:hypothetical protein OPV22_025221 [Ensete ventricosum]|uniref:Uncharacterized protein n=1 Tax=Ensete ventricosum TaxID=4639 RepID=A0AAV8QC32_ENSVE|nr:hypothetical protein OPV22_025221 [Ensete ventricosum]
MREIRRRIPFRRRRKPNRDRARGIGGAQSTVLGSEIAGDRKARITGKEKDWGLGLVLAWGAPLREEPKRRPTETTTAEGEYERGREVSCSGGLYKDGRILKWAERCVPRRFLFSGTAMLPIPIHINLNFQ